MGQIRPVQVFRRINHHLACLLLCVGITACQSTGHGGLPVDWTMQGRVAVSSDLLRRSVNIHWRQQGERFDIHLTGPLGVPVGRIEGDDKSAWLDVPGERRQNATGPDGLFRQHFEFSVPLSSVRHWVRGVMDPSMPHDYGGEHYLQAGWKIEYLAYHDGPGAVLPRKLRISRPEASLTLLVRRWEV